MHCYRQPVTKSKQMVAGLSNRYSVSLSSLGWSFGATMCEKRILITGVSGFLGRLLFKHLTTQKPLKFDVYGLDITRDLSPRYAQEKYVETGSTIAVSEDRFVQCDVTDRPTLHRILAELRIDIVIHLAALLETVTDTDKVLRVNIDGTRNVFDARK